MAGELQPLLVAMLFISNDASPKGNSTLLHSFVIFPVSETIFGMSGCFPVSQGQEMKDLTASSGRKATRGCQCSFSAQVRLKNSHECKKLFLSLVK